MIWLIKFRHKGNLKLTDNFLMRVTKIDYPKSLDKLGQDGVKALMEATPKRTGKTAASWYYRISSNDKGWVISWDNSNTNKWANIAVLIQNGHGTPSGYYVEGIDYINPTIKPLIEAYTNGVWEEVTKNG